MQILVDETDIRDLIELAEEAMGYTEPYFRRKWDMDERWENLKAKLIGGAVPPVVSEPAGELSRPNHSPLATGLL